MHVSQSGNKHIEDKAKTHRDRAAQSPRPAHALSAGSGDLVTHLEESYDSDALVDHNQVISA